MAVAFLAGLVPCVASGQEEKKPDEKKTEKKTSGANPVVLMKTSLGEIEIELDKKNAPISTANFLKYVEKKHYDGLIFHRVISTFMIQGGGFELKGGVPTQKKSMAPIKNEAKNGLMNKRGTIAMARTGDPHSATAQFFINVVDNAGLDYPSRDGWGYAVFGKVTKGMDVVDKIRKVPTGKSKMKPLDRFGNHSDATFPNVPKKAVVMKSVTLKKAKAEAK